jgi:hypothetical protein
VFLLTRIILRLFPFLIGAVLVTGINISCADNIDEINDSSHQVRSITEDYDFHFAAWEMQALSSMITGKIAGKSSSEQEIRLQSQIDTVLLENGIPVFPPLNFKLEKPPHLLVISPRNRIYYLDRVLLRQELSDHDMGKIEAAIDKLGLSSLVVELGGFGATYPPIVDMGADTNFIISTIVEEWLHQYLAFRPLGFLYLLDSLGLRQDRNIIVMNETLAGMVSDEISSQIYARYYGASAEKKSQERSPGFNFNIEMRQTRGSVDQYLSQGDIEEAERYMESRRQIFLSHGYKIRKLNQAYFAFHGIYGKSPASTSPIRNELQLLRAKSQSLKEFLQQTSSMSSYVDLLKVLKE